MDDHNYTRAAPQEPVVHGKALFYVSLAAAVWCLMVAISKYFSTNIITFDGWWKFLIPAAAFSLVALLLSKRRDRELRAHEEWKAQYYEWRKEQEELAQKAHTREMERLEKQLELEKAELARIKAKAAAEFGEK